MESPAVRVSTALVADASTGDSISGPEKDRFLPARQGRRHLARSRPGVFEGDHCGHGHAAQAGNVMDQGSVGSARRSTRTDRGGAPTRHGPF